MKVRRGIPVGHLKPLPLRPAAAVAVVLYFGVAVSLIMPFREVTRLVFRRSPMHSAPDQQQ